MRFSKQENWRGLPCPSPGDLLDPGIEPTSLTSPTLASRFFTDRIWLFNTFITILSEKRERRMWRENVENLCREVTKVWQSILSMFLEFSSPIYGLRPHNLTYREPDSLEFSSCHWKYGFLKLPLPKHHPVASPHPKKQKLLSLNTY